MKFNYDPFQWKKMLWAVFQTFMLSHIVYAGKIVHAVLTLNKLMECYGAAIEVFTI